MLICLDSLQMEQRKQIALFSQTGGEIVNISRALGKWPDVIITNKRPEHLREISSEIPKDLLVELPNKPTTEDYRKVLPKQAIVTLHGWLRILPEDICNEYEIYNGHPGLITRYPELKGKDPQDRAWKGEYLTAGCVIHKVTAGVDEGEVLLEKEFPCRLLSYNKFMDKLYETSLELWKTFLSTNKND